MISPSRGGRFPVEMRPAFNTHVHLPPNFSAFKTVEDAVETAARQGVRIVGSSNFHDLRVYERLKTAAEASGVAALYGLELISVLEEEQRAGIHINDPANPGRAYICGKGIPAPTAPGPAAVARIDAARDMNVGRATQMVERMRDLVAATGLGADITYASIAQEVARRADVPPEWVVLQERHVALGFQELLFERVPADQRQAFLERLYGRAPSADTDDPVAVQGELRARLLRAGGPAFVAETPIPFRDGLQLVLDLEAVPCYPTLADGADPVCGYEHPPEALVERILGHGIVSAELIPVRNAPEIVDRYVSAFRAAGLFVLVGTEHNTAERIPVEPTCRGGAALSPRVRDICWEGTCIVAAHQHLRSTGGAGYVDTSGHLAPGFPDGEVRMRWFAELGEEVIMAATAESATAESAVAESAVAKAAR